MRTPTYLSYSAMALFEKNIEEYFIKNLADTRAPRLPQEKPASIGSAFDAYVKSSLHEALYGVGFDPKYSLDALMEAQVEAHNRDWARTEGQYVFDSYKQAGGYDVLLGLLQKSIEPPRFEFEVKAELSGVPFLGKPDCRYVLPGPVHVIHDFKVNGYCAKSAVSPTKGYMVCNDGFVGSKQNKSHGQAHKQFVPQDFHGLVIDTGYLEDCDTGWADQLTLYGWALGEKVGDERVVLSIDQIVAKPIADSRPLLRLAQFRARVRKSYQEFLEKRLQKCWSVITSGHIFQTLSRAESDQRVAILCAQSIGLQSDGSELENFFNEAVRPAYRG